MFWERLKWWCLRRCRGDGHRLCSADAFRGVRRCRSSRGQRLRLWSGPDLRRSRAAFGWWRCQWWRGCRSAIRGTSRALLRFRPRARRGRSLVRAACGWCRSRCCQVRAAGCFWRRGLRSGGCPCRCEWHYRALQAQLRGRRCCCTSGGCQHRPEKRWPVSQDASCFCRWAWGRPWFRGWMMFSGGPMRGRRSESLSGWLSGRRGKRVHRDGRRRWDRQVAKACRAGLWWPPSWFLYRFVL